MTRHVILVSVAAIRRGPGVQMKTFALLLVLDGPRAAGSPAQEYVIGPEDVLDIAVWDNTAVSRTVPVRPDGKISLPLLNDVRRPA